MKLRDIKGTILPTAALLVAIMIPLCGMTVDVSYYGILRSSLERATEAAAVAASQEYFRSRADGGRTVNEAFRVFKMNVSNDTRTGNYHSATGPGRPPSLTDTYTFTEQDGLNGVYRGSPINVTVTATLNRGKVSVTSEMLPRPFFAQIFSNPSPIRITREAELPPYDIAFVVDLSGSMRFATINTYIGSAWLEPVNMSSPAMLFPDVILYQAQGQFWGTGTMITANNLIVTIASISDVVINNPNRDIVPTATYSNGRDIYINDPKRGFITNTQNSIGLRRTVYTGWRLIDAQQANGEPRTLFDTIQLHRSNNQNTYSDYFDNAASYIEPQASAVYGVMSFIDTVRVYGAAGLNLGLVTFASNSFANDVTQTQSAPELRTNGLNKTLRNTYPYVMLVEPRQFNEIVDRLTIMANGLINGGATLLTNSYPNGGTNINAGLDNAKRTFDRSNRPQAQRVIILFTDGAPSHSFSALGSKVRELTNQGITVYSVVLTLAVNQGTINSFRTSIENNGGEPVIFINNPAQLDEAFLQIADDLGLRLVN